MIIMNRPAGEQREDLSRSDPAEAFLALKICGMTLVHSIHEAQVIQASSSATIFIGTVSTHRTGSKNSIV
jgi:hypothetical protein